MKETIEQYLARGGNVTTLKPYKPQRHQHRFMTNQAKLDAAIKLLYEKKYADAIAMVG